MLLPVETIVPVAGVVLCNLKCLSPMSAVMRVRQTQSLGSLNPVPLVTVTGNNAGWVAYAGLGTQDPYVMASVLPGVLLGMFYVASTYALAEQRRSTMEALMCFYVLVFAAAGVISFECPDVQCSPSQAFGTLSMILSIIFYGSPLPAMLDALDKQATERLHAPLAWTTLWNASLWASYGIFHGDWHMWLAQGFGAAVAAFQLVMIARWPQVPTGPGTASSIDSVIGARSARDS